MPVWVVPVRCRCDAVQLHMQQRRYLRPLLACLVYRTGAGDALVAASLVCVARCVHVGSGSISLICAPAACCATLFLAFPYLDMELEFARCGFCEPGLAHEEKKDATTEYILNDCLLMSKQVLSWCFLASSYHFYSSTSVPCLILMALYTIQACSYKETAQPCLSQPLGSLNARSNP